MADLGWDVAVIHFLLTAMSISHHRVSDTHPPAMASPESVTSPSPNPQYSQQQRNPEVLPLPWNQFSRFLPPSPSSKGTTPLLSPRQCCVYASFSKLLFRSTGYSFMLPYPLDEDRHCALSTSIPTAHPWVPATASYGGWAVTNVHVQVITTPCLKDVSVQVDEQRAKE